MDCEDIPRFSYEAEGSPTSDKGRRKMPNLQAAIAFIEGDPDGVIYACLDDSVDGRSWLRWTSVDHGHIDGKSEDEILQIINVKFADQLENIEPPAQSEPGSKP